ncbi:hypothetical protein J6500_03650 [Bradyrhizobium sp. WSM 1704]|uniref:hypothetical protein n=1 Tax=Bradyrhizobium semiaridum TaxID=2821404 RepID=UPI001CE36568|nr:hypothetical protein [Bradyrhizobium semiaridum]MCA6120998.1 hypothetical protein [Bradyrhizobium semiaridum]
MSRPFAVNETENCILAPRDKDDLVRHRVCRRAHAHDRKTLKFDAGESAARRARVARTLKIVSSSRDAIVEIIAVACATFEIPFH